MTFYGFGGRRKGIRAPDECISTSTRTRLEKIDSPYLKLLFSWVSHSFPFFFFFLILPAQRLHTSGTGALIDPWEQSQIEAETGDGGSFCTLSGDPRERKKGVRCIQNKEMGKGTGPSLMEGWEAGSPSPTLRVGHSP